MNYIEFAETIIVDYIPSTNGNRPGYPMEPEYITVHDTGNSNIGADALNHGSCVKNPSFAASWHFTVDDKRIVQHLPTNENGWHAGDGKNGTGNRKSIGIEICMNQDGNRAAAEALTAKLIAYLMWKFDIGIEKVKQHNNWSGKDCPQVIRARSNGWTNFIAEVKKNAEQINAKVVDKEVPKWQQEAFKSLVEKGVIASPEYWESRLSETITVGEMFGVMSKMWK
jgi:N-acetylmuramoyl-L-alanine amidase